MPWNWCQIKTLSRICIFLLYSNTAYGHGDHHTRLARLNGDIQKQPSAKLHFQRGQLQLELGKPMAALADFEKIPPNEIDTTLDRAKAFSMLGKHHTALNLFNQFIAKYPDMPESLILRARTLIKLGNGNAAMCDYSQAFALKSRPEPDLVFEIANTFETLNLSDLALKILDEAIQRQGPLAALEIAAMDLELRLGKWDAALHRVAEAQRAAARPEPWMSRRASILARAGYITESRAAWKFLHDHITQLPFAERNSHAMTAIARQAHEAWVALANVPNSPLAMGAETAFQKIPISHTSTEVPISEAVPTTLTLMRGPYLQLATPTSLMVRWRTDASVAGRVRYGASPSALNQTVDETNATTEHSVTLTNLTANTVYFYSIGTASLTLAGNDTEHTFTTPPASGISKNTRIWVLGDAGTNNTNQINVRNAFYTYTGTRTPDLCLLLGDNAYGSGLDAEYQTALFNIYNTLLRKTTFWSCLGNHDTDQSSQFAGTYPYFDIFNFPTNGEAGGVASGTEHYYSFNHGNIHFIALDSMTASRATNGAMALWLADDLASNTATWTIAFFHHPPYTKGSHDSDIESELVEMRQNIVPILENGGVDLVLSGHSHCYERSYLLDSHYGSSETLAPIMIRNAGNGQTSGDGAYIKPLSGARSHNGTVYNVAGSAGQVSGGELNHPAMFFSASELGSVVLDINGNRLDSTFLRDNGSVRDSYTILKQSAVDSDNDGMPDIYELNNGLDIQNPADALTDADGDGTSNLDEYAFSRPAATADIYPCTIFRNTATGSNTINFPTTFGRNYRVWWSETLLANDWHIGSATITGTGSNASWTDLSSGKAKCFYKVAASTP